MVGMLIGLAVFVLPRQATGVVILAGAFAAATMLIVLASRRTLLDAGERLRRRCADGGGRRRRRSASPAAACRQTPALRPIRSASAAGWAELSRIDGRSTSAPSRSIPAFVLSFPAGRHR